MGDLEKERIGASKSAEAPSIKGGEKMGKMRAVIIDRPVKAEEIVLSECEIPKVKPGWVLVQVKAFGMNHSEQILRREEILEDYIQKPVIPGIECVGIIEDPSDSSFEKGQKVAALMGGMGRSFDGSYAEYALLPVHHVFAVETSFPWEVFAAVPETYFTAWGSLFQCLHLTAEDVFLIRGATCALGYAAIALAKAVGCKVIATTHRESKLELLADAEEAVLDEGSLAEKLKEKGITKALELVGPKTVKDTLKCMKSGGIVCNTGILGGVYTLDDFDPIKDIPNGVYLTGFFSNDPTQEVMTEIFDFIEEKNITPKVGACYAFSEIKAAIEEMDGGKVNGKIVVKMEAR